MISENFRNYNCKNEELPMICRFSAYSLKRDLADFSVYSPKFSEEYVTGYENAILLAEELVSPKLETVEMKKITDRMFSTMSDLLSPIQYLKGYLLMANGRINLSAADFGLIDLRKGINARDPERVIDRLRDVNKNVDKYKEILTEQGLTDSLQAKFTRACKSIAADRNLQYELFTSRKAIVQGNIGTFNSLYGQLQEICRVGKILYNGVDLVKQQEYTFAELKKRVRRMSKTSDSPENATAETASAS